MFILFFKALFTFIVLAAMVRGNGRFQMPGNGWLPTCFINAGPVIHSGNVGTQTISGTDHSFKKGQKFGTPMIKYMPNGITGFMVSFGYNLDTVNGETFVKISNISSSTIGLVLGCRWENLSGSYTVRGAIVNFFIKGRIYYSTGLFNIYEETVQLSGSYDTTNGFYSVTRK